MCNSKEQPMEGLKTMLDFLNEVAKEEGYTGWYHVYSSEPVDYVDLNDIPQEAGVRFAIQQIENL